MSLSHSEGGITQKDFLLEVVKGNVKKHSTFVIRGHNPSQTATSGFIDIGPIGNFSHLSSAERINISSDSTTDRVGSTGATSVRIIGVDNSYVSAQEVVQLNGTTKVLTTNQYLRINQMVCVSAGSNGINSGMIYASAQTTDTMQHAIISAAGISECAIYTVPLNKAAYLYGGNLNSTKVGGTSPVVEVYGQVRLGPGYSWLSVFDKKLDTSVSDEIFIDTPIQQRFQAKTDVRFLSDTDQNSTDTKIRIYLLLEDE